MKTFNDLGFKIDEYSMTQAVNTLRDIKEQESTIVESMAETLLDRRNPAQFTPEEIDWMKSTAISTITVGQDCNDGDDPYFNLSVHGVGQLKISGRAPTRGEFRGSIVKELIEREKISNGNMTLYAVFQAHLSDLVKHPNFIYLTNFYVCQFVANYKFNPETPLFMRLREETQNMMNAFGKSVYDSLDNEVLARNNNPPNSLSPTAYDFLQKKLQEVFRKVPVSQKLINFIDVFNAFKEQLEIIEKKSHSFKNPSDEYTAATNFTSTLTQARDQLTEGKITTKQFKDTCETACSIAEESALKNHRGWKQVFANIGFLIVSIATLGIANIISKLTIGVFDFSKTNTDSVIKTLNMKATLKDMHDDVEPINKPTP